jgi:hypothetical protein
MLQRPIVAVEMRDPILDDDRLDWYLSIRRISVETVAKPMDSGVHRLAQAAPAPDATQTSTTETPGLNTDCKKFNPWHGGLALDNHRHVRKSGNIPALVRPPRLLHSDSQPWPTL